MILGIIGYQGIKNYDVGIRGNNNARTSRSTRMQAQVEVNARTSRSKCKQ